MHHALFPFIAAGIGTGVLSAWWFGRLAYRRVEVHGPELLNLMTTLRRSSSSIARVRRVRQGKAMIDGDTAIDRGL